MDLPILIPDVPGAALHQKLATALAQVIEGGRLRPGSAFPSTRELAEITQLSRATVVKGMSELRRHGYVVTRSGGKTYVAPEPPRKTTLTHRDGFSSMPSSTNVGYSSQTALQESIQLSTYGSKIDALQITGPTSADLPMLNYGGPPHWSLPIGTWKKLLARRCEAIGSTSLEYSPHPFGLESLRVEIADYLRRVKAINCQSSQVVVFPGSQGALASIASLLIDEGDLVCVENPGYVGARNTFTAVGAQLLPISVDEQGLKVEQLLALPPEVISRLKMIYVTPSFHDPTGVEMPISRRLALIKFVAQHKILIVEDGWDSDYIYIKPHLPTIHALDGGRNVIYIHSFWKALYPLSSAGSMVVPTHLVNVFEKAKNLLDRQTPTLEHQALADYIRQGHFERLLKRTTQALVGRRKELIGALKTAFGERIEVSRQSAAFWLCVNLRSFVRQAEVLQAAADAGLAMIPVSQYLLEDGSGSECRSLEHKYLMPFGDTDDTLLARVLNLAEKV
jgi:GntR family transcriptional regulator / MocR family aminotransferase